MGANFWTSLLTSSLALIALTVIILIIFYLLNMRGVKKQKEYFSNLHQTIDKGQKVEFGNGMLGQITAVNGDTVDIKVKSGAVIEVSRYSISKIIN